MANTISTYTPEEFANCYVLRGYGKKKAALKWCNENNRSILGEGDFELCYHALNQPVIRSHRLEQAVLHRRVKLEEFEYGCTDA